ncbi:smoothelin-like protein 2-like [Platysternon megacephalum]|uniref:Smoothelin-like protein 2-like n=1 Tax=Platysternon megacephalum TaxID=55544 RepID=A0A4D9F101_9SAUR|nr:smoothelin-like protein 2-like [Platysternon megacephalum]
MRETDNFFKTLFCSCCLTFRKRKTPQIASVQFSYLYVMCLMQYSPESNLVPVVGEEEQSCILPSIERERSRETMEMCTFLMCVSMLYTPVPMPESFNNKRLAVKNTP